MKPYPIIIFLAFSFATISTHASISWGGEKTDSTPAISLIPTKVIYQNTDAWDREQLDKLSEEERERMLRIHSVKLALFDYIEMDENWRLRLTLPRESAIKAGILDWEYDRMANSLVSVNEPDTSNVTEKFEYDITPELLEQIKKQMRDRRKLYLEKK